jgi:hypothetical protein
MFGYAKNLEVYGCSVVAYKSIMNTNYYRNHIIKSLVKNKNTDFIGSFMVFDPLDDENLVNHYVDSDGNPTTEGQTFITLKDELTTKIMNSKKRFIAFTIGSIMYTNNVSHHVSILLENKGNTVVIKTINSGLYYLSRSYGDVIDYLVNDIVVSMGKTPVVYHPYIGIMQMGFSFYQHCNPQDYCRGGAIGILGTLFDYRLNIHMESYCQTWCIMMLIHEIDMMNRLKTKYRIEDNYFTTWSTDKKLLEIKLREFILWVVVKYQNKIDFKSEFKREVEASGLDYRLKGEFSSILLDCFQNLHSEIRIPVV